MKILIAASNMVHINNFHRPYIDAFRAAGHSVYVMAKGEGADFDIPFKKRSLSFKNWRLSRKIREIIKKEEFDVIYLHTTLAAFWVRMALKGLKKRPYVVNTVHGYLFGQGCGSLHNKIYLFCEKYLRKQTDEIVVMNQEDYEIATKHRLCLGDVTFSNGMGVRFKENIGEAKRLGSGECSIAFVGEISKRKNQMLLVQAMKSLENCSLTLVGDGDERDTIEAYIKKEGLEQRVFITGFTKEAYEYIKGCDIYASASQIEGLPFNIMEAMYLNKPIVASRIKGHTDLLPSTALFTPGNLLEYVSLIRNNIQKREAKWDVDKYRLENVLKENMKIYLSVENKINREEKE